MLLIGGYLGRGLKRLEKSIQDRVVHQLWPNGGSSLADKVNALESGQAETKAEVRFVRDLLVSMVENRETL